MIKTCLICGKKFESGKHPSQKYCSLKCSGIAQRKNAISKCAYCGKEFYKAKSLIKNYNNSFCCNEHYHLSRRKINEIYIENNYAYMLLETNNIQKKVLFDIEDIEKIKKFCWHLHLRKKDMRFDVCSNTYNNCKKRKYILLPRFLLNCPQNMTIDHINHNTLDNRKNNLRICTTYENNQNKTNNTSGCVGVSWDKAREKWHVMYKSKNLGRYDNYKEAVYVRQQAEKGLFPGLSTK